MTLVAVAWAILAACATLPDEARVCSAAERFSGQLEQYAGRGFAGQAVVVHGDRVVLHSGYGTMAPGEPRPVGADAVMPLASVTKPFLASAVLRLAADGNLSLGDPVGRHLDALEPPWADIPLSALLTHTAGLPAEIANRQWRGPPRFEPVGREDFLRRLQHFAPDHPPGAGFNYSNLGYGVLAAVIEAISARPWHEYLDQALLAPAGIEDIGISRPGWRANDVVRSRDGRRAHSHHLEQPRLGDGMGWPLRGSGDLLARPAAIIAWWRSLRAGTWLPGPWLELWLQPQIREPAGSRYGFGLEFDRRGRLEAIGHSGQDLGYSVVLVWYPDLDLMVYVNSAHADFAADRLLGHFERLLVRR